MPNSASGTNRDKQGRSFVDSPSRGDKYTAQEVLIGNADAIPVNVVSGSSGGGNSNEITDAANENISALKLVRQDLNGVLLADKGTVIDSEVLGLSRTAANTGNTLRIVTYGRVDDTTFSFTLNEPLFLGDNGSITNTAPVNTGEYIVRIGYSLGNGSIFIDIEQGTLIE